MAVSETKLNQKICAVISAAGMSSRMGRFKPLLPCGGSCIAACSVRNLRAAGVQDIVLVTGHCGALLREALTEEKLIFTENPDYASTEMFDSLKIGFAALPDDCTRVLIQPVDMPAIMPETLTALLKVHSPIVRPCCGGKSGHPLVLDAALLPQIMAHNGTDGLRGALNALALPVAELATDDVGTLLDADTPEDYEKLLRLEEERG